MTSTPELNAQIDPTDPRFHLLVNLEDVSIRQKASGTWNPPLWKLRPCLHR